ncbi:MULTISPECIES: phage major capsid protein [Clostridium]|uniref:Phage protein n=2 Tax=root TaxID=1 RepID=A0A174F0V2_9CLOT|nr:MULTISPECIES: phage major capsid protein [Clostridium]MBX9184473.1 phage major capsid protein [Clostridium sp. K04]MDU3523189.1 phage major capsid protein [Clostridium saudiense]CUO43853.1 phage protein [Clostridium disporicum]DAD85249.1 MAG TPA: major capsid protein [Myoviridae sp. ctfr31]
MNKELKELLDKINAKKSEVKNLANENKIEEAQAAKEELKKLQAKFDVLYDLEVEAEEGIKDKIEAGEVKEATNKIKDSTKEFANAARNGFRVTNKMSEGTLVDGGYTVPEDILTRINTYKESKKSLKDLVKVEKVTTNKGQRTFKKRSQQTGFTKVGEGGKIGVKGTPQFERIAYEIDKYAGYFPVTNELLSDSDANITNTLIEWIGDESRVTANKLILEQIATLNEVKLEGIDDIKKALNVTLGQAFKATSKIITNDDGLQYLDTLKDTDGKYLLQPNPSNPMEMRLCAGATIIPIEVIPNDDMATNTNKVPFIIGDLKEGIVFWDRQLMNIKTSDVAVIGDLNAYEEDLTLFRAIEREDVTIRDSKAIVNGYIDITP